MYCTRCGTPANHKRYCTQCGFELKKAPTQAARVDSRLYKTTLRENLEDQPGDLLVGRTIDHRYFLESRLGVGGMGSVYRAKRLHIGDAAAIKILNPVHTTDPRTVERFHREAKVGASLRHPNVARVYDFGVSEDQLIYLVMELVEGDDLRSIILQRGHMSQTVAVEIIVQVCAALSEAHRKNVVHRDLKPENILVQSTPTGRRVKVLDFGIAYLSTLTDDKLTQTGSIVGTPHYMSPEQCMGEQVDQRSDIYSLGIILFEMLAGTAPFNSTTPTAIAVQQVSKTPPSLRDLNPNVSPELEAVVMHALRKSPEERPQTASALAEELLAAVKSNQPMLIGPAAEVEQASATSTFSPARLAISLVLLLAIAAGFGLWRYIKNNKNSEQSTAPAVTQNDQSAAQTPLSETQSKIGQPVTPNPAEAGEKSISSIEAKPSPAVNNQPAKRKVVVTKKRLAAKQRVVPKKADDDKKEDSDDDRRKMDDDEDRYRRYRYNSFGPGYGGRYHMRRMYRGRY